MKKKIANVFKSIPAFAKSHSVGTFVVALLIIAVIVGFVFKDSTRQAPGGKNDASSTVVSSVSEELTASELAQKEAEAKAKAEQEAAEKAAAEQKAKQEAEEKAAAEQKAKEEAAKKETSSKASTSSKKSSSKKEEAKKEENVPATTVKDPAEYADPNPNKTYEENKKKHENEVKDYLKEHDIDPKTAGETGELCPHCGKKIWNPDKYGLNNPGYPDNYEHSGYCTGACAIKVG